jgi:hypothetical protein
MEIVLFNLSLFFLRAPHDSKFFFVLPRVIFLSTRLLIASCTAHQEDFFFVLPRV